MNDLVQLTLERLHQKLASVHRETTSHTVTMSNGITAFIEWPKHGTLERHLAIMDQIRRIEEGEDPLIVLLDS